MEEKSYYIHDSGFEPSDGMGIAITKSEEGAWKEFGEYLWDLHKGTEELTRINGKMHVLPSGFDTYEDDIESIDLKKCDFVSTRSFCIPPHAPECYNGYMRKDRHEWDEDIKIQHNKSEWYGCIDYSIPCRHCNIMKIIRVGKVPINGVSKITPVRYETRPLLQFCGTIITSEPKQVRMPKLEDNTRICGVCTLGDEEVELFYADEDKDAIAMAELMIRGACIGHIGDHVAYVKYYLGVAPVGTKIDEEIFLADLLKGEEITEAVASIEPVDYDCVGKDHIWSDESYMISACQVGGEGQDETDAVKYCKVKICKRGKIIRVGLYSTYVLEYIDLCQTDVNFKDHMVNS